MCFLSESGSANRALKVLLRVMYEHVLHQDPLLGEGFATFFTIERFLARVGPGMILEILVTVEIGLARGTHEMFRLVVNTLVLH